MSENIREFSCEKCSVDGMDLDAFKKHMQEAHGLDTANLQGRREMISHLDGRDWYGGANRWTFGDLVVIESYQYKRTKDTMMY